MPAAPSTGQEKIRVGVMNCAEPLSHQRIIESFLGVLEKSLGKDRLQVEMLDIEGLEKGVLEKKLDIFLGSAGFYRALQREGVRDLATVTTRYAPDADAGDGAVFFVPAGSKIKTLDDLAGKTVAGKSGSAFAGWLAATGELALEGKDPEKLFGRTLFVGWDMKSVVREVLEGRADAGVLPVCFFEEMELLRPALSKQIRLINEMPAKNFACRTSTRLYPNWTVAITPSMPPEAARAVSAALLETDMNRSGIQWNIATKFEKVDEMLEALRIGPFAYLREWTLKRIAADFWPLLLLAGSVFCGVVLYAASANRLIKQRTAQLSDAIKRESRYRQTIEETAHQMTTLRRMNAVNKLSSILAHELRQPLNAVVCYAHGLRRLIDKPESEQNKERIDATLDRMAQQAKFAEAVVKKVRSYAKNEAQKTPTQLAPAVEQAVRRWVLSGHSQERVIEDLDESIVCLADAFEIELLVVNLLRNAASALSQTADAKIRVSLRKDPGVAGWALLEIADNGPKLSEADLRAIRDPLCGYEGKSLGYGLLIVREIAADHGGEAAFEPGARGGLIVCIRLPMLKEEAK